MVDRCFDVLDARRVLMPGKRGKGVVGGHRMMLRVMVNGF
jgi:hypothetical protein